MNGMTERTVERLSLYRRLAANLLADKVSHVFSHDIGRALGITAAQVRRDMMVIGFTGSPTRGYDVELLKEAITQAMDAPAAQGVALVGVGNLGRAFLSYFTGRHPKMAVTAAFDADPEKVGRVINGCRCHAISEIPAVVEELGIRTVIVAVPAEHAQAVTDAFVAAGVTGVLNFAPVRLRVSPSVFVEHVDLTMFLEKTGFFARQKENR